MKQKKEKTGVWKIRGYMTLEASLIMPVAVVLTAFLMILTFHLYTVCFLNQAAYIAAFRGSIAGEDSRSRASVAEEELDKLLEGRILPLRNLEKEVSASATSVQVTLKTELALPAAGILPVENRSWGVEAVKKVQVRDAAAFIRGVRKLASLG